MPPSCKIVVLQQEIPLSTIKHILRVCHQHGIITILNPAPASPELTLQDEEFGFADIIIPNETEAQLITGIPEGKEEEMMDILASQHPQQLVVMTRGKRGAIIRRGNEVCFDMKGMRRQSPSYSHSPSDL